MHGPYPGELRLRVIDFVEGGGSRRGAAGQFEVSVSSAIGWVQQLPRRLDLRTNAPRRQYFALGEAFPSIRSNVDGAPVLIGEIEIDVSGMLGDADVDRPLGAVELSPRFEQIER